MKSGPTLKGCTFRPLLLRAAINPKVTVVFPTPLWVPAMRKAGIMGGLLEQEIHNFYLAKG
jgi:hypothetical protein